MAKASVYPRDLIGYAGKPPDPKWPNGARLALNFVLNYEEGSEYSIQDGDGYSESTLTDAGSGTRNIKGRDLGAESLFEYGSRVGFWRIRRIFMERGLPLTVYGCALALDRNPATAEAIRNAGWDIVSHGWRWINHFHLSEREEREHIRKAVASFQKTLGQRPIGWYCRYAPSVNTRRLLVEEGGFLYDSDSYADELPYWTVQSGKPHLIVPYTITNNDTQFMRGNAGNADDWFHFIRDAFDLLYREGKTQPKMMNVGLHMRIMGHPARAAALERLLDHVLKHPDVWVAARNDIARHWIATHPAPEVPETQAKRRGKTSPAPRKRRA